MPTTVESSTIDLRYPIGRPAFQVNVTPADLVSAVATLAATPAAIRQATSGLSDLQIDTPYRDDGWTVRQLIHHIADSHMNAFLRVRLALTEDSPAITAYDEAAWARLADSAAPIELSLSIIDAVHARWVLMLNSLDAQQWQREFRHPERGPSTIAQATLLYRWHSLHHTAHITELRKRKSW